MPGRQHTRFLSIAHSTPISPEPPLLNLSAAIPSTACLQTYRALSIRLVSTAVHLFPLCSPAPISSIAIPYGTQQGRACSFDKNPQLHPIPLLLYSGGLPKMTNQEASRPSCSRAVTPSLH